MQHASVLLVLGRVSVWKTVQIRLYLNSDINALLARILTSWSRETGLQSLLDTLWTFSLFCKDLECLCGVKNVTGAFVDCSLYRPPT